MKVPEYAVNAKILRFMQSIASRVGGSIVQEGAGDGAVVAQKGVSLTQNRSSATGSHALNLISQGLDCYAVRQPPHAAQSDASDYGNVAG